MTAIKSLFSPEQERRLIAAAKSALANLSEAHNPRAKNKALDEPVIGGVFLTLRRLSGDLRGCIGTFASSDTSLEGLVAKLTIAAATRDPRFPPVSRQEAQELQLEIHICSEIEPMQLPDDFEPGIHGVKVQLNEKTAVLLPQVATDNGLDRNGFLKALAQKARTDPATMRQLGRFGRFTTVSIYES